MLRTEFTQNNVFSQGICKELICHELLREVFSFCNSFSVVLCIQWSQPSIEAHKIEEIY